MARGLGTRRGGLAALIPLAALLLLASAPAAGARSITFPIEADLRAQLHPMFKGASCPSDERGLCSAPYEGDGVLTGDLQGAVHVRGRFWLTAEGRTYEHEVITFVGTVEDCGRGSFTYYAHPGPPEGLDGLGIRIDETWDIAPGSSSSGLPGLSGSGVSAAILYPDLSIDAHYTGTLTCDVAGPAAEAPKRTAGGKRRSCRGKRDGKQTKRRCRRGRGS